jgi:hypothetical protein
MAGEVHLCLRALFRRSSPSGQTFLAWLEAVAEAVRTVEDGEEEQEGIAAEDLAPPIRHVEEGECPFDASERLKC